MPKRISIGSLALAAVLSFLIIQLNIYFAWTSHVGEPVGVSNHSSSSTALRSFLVNEATGLAKLQLRIPQLSAYYSNLASASTHHGSLGPLEMKLFIDSEVILFTLAVFVISLFLFQRKGIFVSILRTFEITSLTILPLGLEIYFFDHHEFNIHASDIQKIAGLSWFTNADVLYFSAAIFGMCLCVEALRYAKRSMSPRARQAAPGIPVS